MARLDALSIELLGEEAKDKLAEEYGVVIENIATRTLSGAFANRQLSGDPTAGTMEAKRFANIVGQAYGTARGAGKGQAVKAEPVVVAINDNKEYIEEVEEKDLQMYGVNGLIEKRTANHEMAMAIDNDIAFFAEMVNAGTVFTETGDTEGQKLESAIGAVASTKNEYVNGVPRNLIKVVMNPIRYGKVRDYIDTGIKNSRVDVGVDEFGMFHGVEVYSSVNLPTGTDYVVFIDEAVAQPKHLSIYNPAKVELSDATAFGAFLYKGTKAVTPDLIKVVLTAGASDEPSDEPSETPDGDDTPDETPEV